MTTTERARTFLDEARSLVDRALDAWMPADDPRAPRLAEAMRYSVLAGGKRLRPGLALAAARAVGGRDEDVLPLACALELIHTYSLIHDDLPAMDDDDLRRGRPTSHKVFGEALAILAGDALHTLAFDLVLAHTPDAARGRDLALLLARASGHEGMVGGQVDDLAAEGADRDGVDLDRLEGIHRRKTGALIEASVVGGARAGGASGDALEGFRRYGASLGLAFQIADDVLDATGTAEVLGKTPGKDAADDKLTYVALEGVEAARARGEREIAAALDALAGLGRAGILEGVDADVLLASLAHFVAHRDR